MGLDPGFSRLRGPRFGTPALVAVVSLVSWGVLAAPAAAQPLNTRPPAISGSPQFGQTLTETPGSWSNAAGAVGVQWEDCNPGSGCTTIPGSPTAPGSHYTPQSRDIGQWITVSETASDGSGNIATAIAAPVGPVTLAAVTARMRWTFYYAPTYTKVLALFVRGLSSGMTVVEGCHGRGCPFAQHTFAIAANRECAPKRTCIPPGTLDLTPTFRGRRLVVGARATVAITRPGGIGRFYRFTVLSRRGPRIKIACLVPGAMSPGAAC